MADEFISKATEAIQERTSTWGTLRRGRRSCESLRRTPLSRSHIVSSGSLPSRRPSRSSQAAARPHEAAERREMTGISEYRPRIAIPLMTCGNGL